MRPHVGLLVLLQARLVEERLAALGTRESLPHGIVRGRVPREGGNALELDEAYLTLVGVGARHPVLVQGSGVSEALVACFTRRVRGDRAIFQLMFEVVRHVIGTHRFCAYGTAFGSSQEGRVPRSRGEVLLGNVLQ